jgi:hypothetical protein
MKDFDILWRYNFNGKLVRCGTIETYFENNIEFFDIFLFKNVFRKFELPNFMKINEHLITNDLNIVNKLIVKSKETQISNNEIFLLKDFKRIEKHLKDKSKHNKKKLPNNNISKELDKIFHNKEYYLNLEKQRKEELKLIKKNIINKKNKKESLQITDDYINDNLSSLGDFFNNKHENNTKEKDLLLNGKPINKEEYNILIEEKDKNLAKTNHYKYKNSIKRNEKLVLWDIENVNFFDDFAIITKLLPKDSIKIFSYSKKNHKGTYLKNNNIDFLLNKLRKRKWIEKRTKKIADDVLIEEFNNRKNKIKELYLISSDKDFKKILDEALTLNIKVFIINNNKNYKKSWFNEKKYNFIKI